MLSVAYKPFILSVLVLNKKYDIQYHDVQHKYHTLNVVTGSAKANGREPKSCLGQVFNFKLCCFAQQKHE